MKEKIAALTQERDKFVEDANRRLQELAQILQAAQAEQAQLATDGKARVAFFNGQITALEEVENGKLREESVHEPEEQDVPETSSG